MVIDPILSSLNQVLVTTSPFEARALLTSNPQLTYALFQAMLMMDIVDASVLQVGPSLSFCLGRRLCCGQLGLTQCSTNQKMLGSGPPPAPVAAPYAPPPQNYGQHSYGRPPPPQQQGHYSGFSAPPPAPVPYQQQRAPAPVQPVAPDQAAVCFGPLSVHPGQGTDVLAAVLGDCTSLGYDTRAGGYVACGDEGYCDEDCASTFLPATLLRP